MIGPKMRTSIKSLTTLDKYYLLRMNLEMNSPDIMITHKLASASTTIVKQVKELPFW